MSPDVFIIYIVGGASSSLSLSSLPPPPPSHQPPAGNNISAENGIMELNIESMAIEERCDSPILEGMDSELAKYAKLRDLQQAYNPPADDPTTTKPTKCDMSGRLSALRHPDGASNPDLRAGSLGPREEGRREVGGLVKPTDPLRTEMVTVSSASQRSPGTGRSSSGSDQEESSHSPPGGREPCLYPSPRDPCSNKVTPVTEPCLPPSNPETLHQPRHSSSPSHRSLNSKRSPVSKSFPKLQPPPPPENSPAEKSPSKENSKGERKIPRFSRLFGSTRKISRSPSQANKPNEDKLRSKSSKHKQHGKPALIQPLSTENNKNSGSVNNCSKSSELISSKKSKMSSCKDSKNVKGTLSSEHLCEERRKHQPRSRNIFKGLKKTRNQGVNLVSLPSGHQPNPTASCQPPPATKARVGSGYDSGIEVTSVCGGSRRLRGRGASVEGVKAATARRVSRTQCRSSGYESIGLESERDSLDSCQGALQANIASSSSDRVSVKKQRNNNPSPIPIIDYDQSFVQRLDCLWRFQEIKRLKKQQEQLKGELSSAKDRINVDPKRWSYDLHTKDSGLDHTDPNFVEAFQRETEILGKRVAACQAHVVLTTCFDRQQPGGAEQEQLGDSGCTADCVPSWDIQDTVGTLVSEL